MATTAGIVDVADVSLIGALGPLKLEFVRLGSSTSVSNGDTYDSKLVRPLGALFIPTADATGTAPSCTISGKIVTMNDPTSTGILMVVGF